MRNVRAQPPTLLLILTTLVFALHVIEEYTGHLWTTDPVTQWFIGLFRGQSFGQAIYATFHGVFLLLLATLLLNQWRPFGQQIIFGFLSMIMLLELYHVGFAVLAHDYYPGAVTAVGLAGVAVLVWIQMVKEWWMNAHSKGGELYDART